MIGKVGDRIVVESEQVGQEPREGEIVGVNLSPSGPHYRVHWNDGHESFFMPESGSAKILPASPRERRKRSA